MSFESALSVYDRRMQRHACPDPEVLCTAPALIDDDTLADCCLLLTIIARTKPERVAEFFSLTGDRHEKMAFLLRYGSFEQGRWKQ